MAHEQDPQRRAALSARMLERCEGAQFSVARVDGGVWLWAELGEEKVLVAMPRDTALRVAIMLLGALANGSPPNEPAWRHDQQLDLVGGDGRVASWQGLELHAYKGEGGWHWMVFQGERCLAESRDGMPSEREARARVLAVAAALCKPEP